MSESLGESRGNIRCVTDSVFPPSTGWVAPIVIASDEDTDVEEQGDLSSTCSGGSISSGRERRESTCLIQISSWLLVKSSRALRSESTWTRCCTTSFFQLHFHRDEELPHHSRQDLCDETYYIGNFMTYYLSICMIFRIHMRFFKFTFIWKKYTTTAGNLLPH